MTSPATRELGDAEPSQPLPYSLQASSELSRDFFLTDQVLIQSGDQVLPFINPNNGNAVEALVFSSGALSHLRRDPTAASGWSFAAFDLQGVFNTVSNVALAANGTDVYALLFGDPDETGDPAWLTRLTGAATWDAGISISYGELGLDPETPLGTVKGGISREGQCYFYTSWVDGTTTTLGGWIATGATDPDDALDYQQFLQLDTSTETVDDLVILYDTNTSDPASPTGFAVVLMNDGNLNVYVQDGEVFDTDPMDNSGAVNVTELMWAWASPAGNTGIPGYVYQQSGATVFADEHGNLSFIGAPLATKIMNETTDDVSTMVKVVIDAVGNIGAAVCIAEATSLPTP